MKIFIADHSQVVRARIMNVLSDIRDVTVVGSAQSVSDALTGVSRLRPDVVFLDSRLCDSCSIDLLRLMKTPLPDLRVIILTDQAPRHARTRQQSEFGGADFLVDTTSDLAQIGDILLEFKHRSL